MLTSARVKAPWGVTFSSRVGDGVLSHAPLPWMPLAGSARKLRSWVLPPAVEWTEVNWLPWGLSHTLASLAPAAANQPHTDSATQREITGCWASA